MGELAEGTPIIETTRRGPCTFVGATSPVVSKTTAMVVGLWGCLQPPQASVALALSGKQSHPLFATPTPQLGAGLRRIGGHGNVGNASALPAGANQGRMVVVPLGGPTTGIEVNHISRQALCAFVHAQRIDEGRRQTDKVFHCHLLDAD